MSGLLEHSRILIYGRVVAGITLDAAPAGKKKSDQSDASIDSKILNSAGADKKLATVFGFEFEGHYYDLPKPAILLVHGEPSSPQDAGAVVGSDPKLADDIKVWSYDKADFSVRLDTSSGPLEDILLEQALDDSGVAAQTSAKRVSGKRMSGD
ncbi:MAG: hypothetical protein GY875_01650 [Gammaproteobacteria bacterium]|nr:hypothetical protein [Gammaproteobacteria bacterium]